MYSQPVTYIQCVSVPAGTPELTVWMGLRMAKGMEMEVVSVSVERGGERKNNTIW